MEQRRRKRLVSARASPNAKPQPVVLSFTAADRAALQSISESGLFTLEASRGMYAGERVFAGRLRPAEILTGGPAHLSLSVNNTHPAARGRFREIRHLARHHLQLSVACLKGGPSRVVRDLRVLQQRHRRDVIDFFFVVMDAT